MYFAFDTESFGLTFHDYPVDSFSQQGSYSVYVCALLFLGTWRNLNAMLVMVLLGAACRCQSSFFVHTELSHLVVCIDPDGVQCFKQCMVFFDMRKACSVPSRASVNQVELVD